MHNIEVFYAVELTKPTGQTFLAHTKHGGPHLFPLRSGAREFINGLSPHIRSRSRVVKLEVTLRTFDPAACTVVE